MRTIFVTTVPFGNIDSKPLELLRQTGWDIKMNPLGRKLKPDEVLHFAKEAHGIIAGTEDLTYFVKNAQQLKIISRVGIGLDSVPLKLCRERNIAVCYTPDAVTKAVAEFTLGLMINLTRYIGLADRQIREKKWERFIGQRIGKSIIGLIGFGRIGLRVAHLLSIFKPRLILVNDIKDKSHIIEEFRKSGIEIIQTEKEEIYQQADIISLHLPYSRKTKNLINAKTLCLFKRGSFLINTSRGGVVHELDLYNALVSQHLSGAALDVFEVEPYNGKLMSLENALLSSHMGSCSYDCRASMELDATEDLIRFFKGETLRNPVPPEEYEYQL